MQANRRIAGLSILLQSLVVEQQRRPGAAQVRLEIAGQQTQEADRGVDILLPRVAGILQAQADAVESYLGPGVRFE